MTKFDKIESKQDAVAIRKFLEQKIAPLLAEANLTMKLGNAVYQSGEITFKQVNIQIAAGDNAEKRDALKLKRLRSYLMQSGVIVPSDERTVFESARYKLVGHRPSAWKNPWTIVDKRDGKTYVCTSTTAQREFGSIPV